MKCLTYFTNENHRIDIHNSWSGKEVIFYNGVIVSRQQNFFGSTHSFHVTEQGQEIVYQVKLALKWPWRLGLDIYRNGRALLLS